MLSWILGATLILPGNQDKGSVRTVRVGLSLLRVVTEGQGRPCLVLGSSVYYPRTFSKSLRKHLQLIFVDLPWFAETAPSTRAPLDTLPSLIEKIETVRRALKIDKPIVMGHSIHGTIALEYARKHPQHVSRLVLVCAPVLMTSPQFDAAAELAWNSASPERRRLQEENWKQLPDFSKHPELQPDVENYLAMAPKYWYDPRYDARWLWAGMTIHSEALHNVYAEMFKGYDMFGKVKTVPVPTFAATGQYDYVIPADTWLRHRKVPNLTVSVFPRSGHTPQLEQPELFDKRLLAWLKVTPQRGGGK